MGEDVGEDLLVRHRRTVRELRRWVLGIGLVAVVLRGLGGSGLLDGYLPAVELLIAVLLLPCWPRR